MIDASEEEWEKAVTKWSTEHCQKLQEDKTKEAGEYPHNEESSNKSKDLFIPGMIRGHHALTADATLRLPETICLQEELMEEYSKEEFQMKLYAGWYATDDIIERHKWRQAVCMEVQRPIFPKYGFEASRRGVAASGYACRTPEHGLYRDGEITRNYVFMDWLINPDAQEKGLPPGSTSNYHCTPATQEGDIPSSGYHIFPVRVDDEEAIRGVARCQGALAGAHQAVYKELCEDLEVQDWFHVLGCGNVHDALERGVLILAAISADTRRVAGYISCTCSYGTTGSGEHSDGPFAHINNLVVMSQHRGHGVGKMLFDELSVHLSETSASVLNDMRIGVAEKNSRAKDWYQRLGFSVIGTSEVLGRNRVKILKLQRKMDTSDFEDMFGN